MTRCSYYPHFTEEETEAQKDRLTLPGLCTIQTQPGSMATLTVRGPRFWNLPFAPAGPLLLTRGNMAPHSSVSLGNVTVVCEFTGELGALWGKQSGRVETGGEFWHDEETALAGRK